MNRQQVVTLLIVGFVSLSCGQSSARKEDPPDLQKYIADVREHGMTDYARGDLNTVASIRTGGMILTFEKEEATGSFSQGYMGTGGCPLKGADQKGLKEKQAKLQEKNDRDMVILRKYADSDGSGFVTTAESREFKDLVEFGYLAAHVVESETTATAVLARARRLAPDQVVARIAKYNELAKRLNESSEFKSPLVDLTGPASHAAGSGSGT